MLILEEFTDSWNYTFIIVMTIAIFIGTILTLRKMKKQEKQQMQLERNKKRKDFHK